jgi:hypothetical protein
MSGLKIIWSCLSTCCNWFWHEFDVWWAKMSAKINPGPSRITLVKIMYRGHQFLKFWRPLHHFIWSHDNKGKALGCCAWSTIKVGSKFQLWLVLEYKESFFHCVDIDLDFCGESLFWWNQGFSLLILAKPLVLTTVWIAFTTYWWPVLAGYYFILITIV